MDSEFDTVVVLGSLAMRAYRFVRGLALMYTGFGLLTAVLLALQAIPGEGLARARLLLGDAVHGGLGGLVLTSLVLAVMALGGTLLVVAARRRGFQDESVARSAFPLSLARFTPSLLAQRGQAVVMPAGALLLCGLSWFFSHVLTFAPRSPDASLAAGVAIFLAFPSLIAERSMHGFAASQMPEAPPLRRVLLLVTILLGIAGCLEIGLEAGLAWLQWPIRILLWLPALVASEFAFRALGRLFAPPPSDSEALAVADSLLLSLFTKGIPAPGTLLREHFGLDFARSWAVQYLRAAALPAIVATTLFCWSLSGLALIDYDQRGVYERLGEPVAVLKPGLHLLLPWPLGRLRPVEFGTVHTIVAGLDHRLGSIETVGVEATLPANMNRLWESINPTEVEYLVASRSSGQQGFQVVSAEMRVLYRTGLSDKDALLSLYSNNDQDILVRTAAARLATQYFASHTLDDVMGARRNSLQEAMQASLQRNLRDESAGVDIVAVEIEAIHPPAGAADSYHAVQAAEINADASIADETARAEHTIGIAQQEATQLVDSATADAAETLQRAQGEAFTFDADLRSSRPAPLSFLMERRFSSLISLLSTRQIVVMDSQLSPSQAPTIDMRPLGQGGSGRMANAPLPVSPEITPGTSTEGATPPMTSEQADEDDRQTREGTTGK